MGRGRDDYVECSNCGRRVPRHKAVVRERAMGWFKDFGGKKVVVPKRKKYYCISCAKHFRIID